MEQLRREWFGDEFHAALSGYFHLQTTSNKRATESMDRVLERYEFDTYLPKSRSKSFIVKDDEAVVWQKLKYGHEASRQLQVVGDDNRPRDYELQIVDGGTVFGIYARYFRLPMKLA